METQTQKILNDTEESLVPASGESEFVQGELVRILWAIHDEATLNRNVKADSELLNAAFYIEEKLLESEVFDFEERMELRNRFEAIRLTLALAIKAAEWAEDQTDVDPDEEEQDIQVPVLTGEEFYGMLFDAVARFIEANPKPIRR